MAGYGGFATGLVLAKLVVRLGPGRTPLSKTRDFLGEASRRHGLHAMGQRGALGPWIDHEFASQLQVFTRRVKPFSSVGDRLRFTSTAQISPLGKASRRSISAPADVR